MGDKPKRYRVSGSRPYLGHEPGSVFDADLTPEQERRAIERGSISPSRAQSTIDAPAAGENQEQ